MIYRQNLLKRKRGLPARLYGVMNYEMAISDISDRTYVLERVCGVCVGKRRFVAFSSGLACNWVDEGVQLRASESCE